EISNTELSLQGNMSDVVLNGSWSWPTAWSEIQFDSDKWSDIMAWLLPISKQNNVKIIVVRLILAAVSYFAWQERNNRVHRKDGRNPDQLSKIIADTVRLKLPGIRFKKKDRVVKMRKTWRIDSICMDDG
nr:hypothetical protein [Tanacetum cinerariifolium]